MWRRKKSRSSILPEGARIWYPPGSKLRAVLGKEGMRKWYAEQQRQREVEAERRAALPRRRRKSPWARTLRGAKT